MGSDDKRRDIMQQYFTNRTLLATSEIDSYEGVTQDKIFANERVDENWNKKHLSINNCTFSKMGFKKSKFSQCDLSFCVFIDCYFKKAEIEQTKFVSCIFIRCNFDFTFFNDCNFEYATFDDCFVPYKQMKNNLPHEKENLCLDLCKNLAIQSLNLGEIKDYREYLFEQRHADERHSIKKLFHKSDSYYKKYNLFEGICGLFSFIKSKISQFCWGYGEKLATLIRNIVFLILACAVPYYICRADIFCEHLKIDSFWSAIYLSTCSFLNISNVTFNTTLLRIVWITENIIGVIFIGLFVTALFRRINKR